MPTFEFTSPDGKTYSVEGPEGATADQAFKILQTQIGAQPADPQPQGGSSIGGVGKALASGLAEGVTSLAGLPGDIYHLGLRALGDKLTPESRFGSAAVKRAVEGVTGEFYKPQGTAENIANKIGQFAPAVIGGPETLAVKLATRVAAPAVGSEIGGQVAGPYGEVAGALAGAVGGTAAVRKLQQATAARNAATTVPTVDELKNAARAGYKSQDVTDVRIKPSAVDDLATKIENDLVSEGFRASNQGQTFGIINELRGAPQSVAVADLDSARKALGVIAKEKDAVGIPTANAVSAQRAIKQIDDFLPNLTQGELIAGNANKANAILGEARQNWGAAKRSEQVKTLLSNAELNAASANSGGNLQNSIKQAFKPLLKNNAAKAVGYNADEIDALNKVVRGTWSGSAARAAGNLLGGGGGLGMLASGAVGYEAGGAPGAIAAGLAGRGLKMAGTKSTFNAVRDLDKLIRSRSPAAVAAAAKLPPSAIQALPSQSRAILAALMSTHPVASMANQPRQ